MDTLMAGLGWLDDFGTKHAGLLMILATLGTLIAAIPVLRARKRRAAPPPDPTFTDPPDAAGSLSRYSARAVDLLGRDHAMGQLQAFLASDSGFAWMQLAGVGGQGKSRLGYELTLWARERGWRAGLMERPDLEAFAENWAEWRPSCRHLLVVDYVIGREAQVKPLIQALAARADTLTPPVRLLLLERQRWDRGGLAAGIGAAHGRAAPGDSGGRAEWFLALAERHDGDDQILAASRFKTGVLELQRLAQRDLIAIVRGISTREGAPTKLPDERIAEQLERIDSAGRPLYAYFLGQALGAGQDPSAGAGWQREDLLAASLQRDRESRWQAFLQGAAPCLGDNGPAERLAVLATMAGLLNCKTAERQGLIPHANAETRRQALVMTDGPLGGTSKGASELIPALQPDLLGEWLVLSVLDSAPAAVEILDQAWRHAPDGTAGFLQRLSQDFPAHPVTEELLQREPPDAAATEALSKVASAILVNLYRAHRPVAKPILTALTLAANDGDGRAMANLGVCYEQGLGVEPDLDQALTWFRKGAEAGDGRAMANLGICYRQGLGVEPDLDQALTWYRKGAEAGDGFAMANLGFCYQQGLGVEPDLDQALTWYRKGAEAGDGRAMANLGFCYGRGLGVEPDLDQALIWYRKGAEAGDGLAMANLGFWYQRGLGVERDLDQALTWYRKGAEAGDGLAMANLGVCYQKGLGVEPDLEQALTWYRKGAEAGDGLAMTGLGFGYEQGLGVEPDLEQALTWYRKGAEAGDETAAAQLRTLKSALGGRAASRTRPPRA